MIEPTGHCPFLGLKQNRAIRFAAPTPEHRCYVQGEPIEIPVDQATYCLSQGHVRCPLYMGLTLATTGDTTATTLDRADGVPRGGMRGWLATLPPRDRAIYLLMLGLLLLIIAAYLVLSLRSLLGSGGIVAMPTTKPTATVLSTAMPTGAPQLAAPTQLVPSPTDLPTDVPVPTPTDAPPTPSLMLPPTRIADTPTSDQRLPTSSVVPPLSAPPTAIIAPPTAVPPTQAVVRPTAAPINPPAAPTSTPAPPVAISTEQLTLYFGDTTGTLFVPVQRSAQVENHQVARAALRELLAGPRGRLQRLLLPDAQLLNLTITAGTAIVNFDRAPTGAGDQRGMYAIVLTLTQFQSIQQVQLQVNGQNVGGSIKRPAVNPLNPQNLSDDVAQTSFLPLYFPSIDGAHDVRIIRMVPKTTQVAEATMRALLEGPGGYGSAVRRIIPVQTELRGIRLDGNIIIVDFTQPFADAADRDAAVRTIALSLTTLPNVTGVQFLVEGRSLGEFWNGTYGGVVGRPVINGE